jgi:actin-like protein 6A
LAVENTHPLLISEPNKTNKHFRKSMCEIFFEEKLTPSMFLCKKAMLSMYSCGKSNGVVLDSGAFSTTLTPIEEGYAIQQGVMTSSYGGEDITRLLNMELLEKGVKPSLRFMRDSYMDVENIDPRIDSSFVNYHMGKKFSHWVEYKNICRHLFKRIQTRQLQVLLER